MAKQKKDPLKNGADSAEAVNLKEIRNEKKQRRRDPERWLNVFMPYFLVIVAIFLAFCIFFVKRDDTGLFGAYLCDGLYIAFGRACLLLPILMLNLALFWRRDRANGQLLWKICVSVVFLSLVCALIQLRYLGQGFYALALDERGAGAVGWALGTFFHRLVGKIGTGWICGMVLLVLLPFLVGTTPRQAVLGLVAWIRRRNEKRKEKAQTQVQSHTTQIPDRPQKPEATALPTQTAENADMPSTQQTPHQTPTAFDIAIAGVTGANASNGASNGTSQGAPASSDNASSEPDYFDRRRFAPSDEGDSRVTQAAQEATKRGRFFKQKRVVGPSQAPYIDGAQDVRGEPAYSRSNPTVPQMEPAQNREENNWLEIKSREQFAPSKDPILPDNIPRSDTISHVRTVQLPPYQEDTVLETERTTIETTAQNDEDAYIPGFESAQEADIVAVDYDEEEAPFDIDRQMTKTEVLDPQHGVTDTAPTGQAVYDSLAATLEKFITPQKVKKDEDTTPHYFDRPTPATPAPQPKPKAPQSEFIAPPRPYSYPPTTLLKHYDPPSADIERELRENAEKLVQKLQEIRVGIQVTGISRGPTITRYEVMPDVGIRVKQVLNAVDDIALYMASSGIRTEAPIPGKNAIGIEIPNRTVATVGLRALVENETFLSSDKPLYCALGEDVTGQGIYLDLAKMPHLLIAGATGTGKSVCLNSLIASLLFRSSPEDVKLILIDPKKVELSVYNGLPHLLIPTVTDPRKAAGALRWATQEMDRRYQLFENCKDKNGSNARNIEGYNAMRKDNPELPYLPMIVIIIDELADLMQTAPDDVEGSIARLTQLARAAGIHMIIGTQRPSVDVVTGKIKSNIPSRIAFTVASQIDSRTILDMAGAEKLIGRGDMLYAPIGTTKPMRVQGAFISDKEVGCLVEYIKSNNSKLEYDHSVIESIDRAADELDKKNKKESSSFGAGDEGGDISEDEVTLLKQCVLIAVEEGKISASYLQMKLKIGFQKAKRMICYMESLGVIGEADGQKSREVIITRQEYEEMLMNDEIWQSVKI